MAKLRVRVKKVKYRDEDSKYTVFDGILMKKGKKSPWRETKETATFVGQLLLCIPNDKFDLEASLTESRRYGEQYQIETYHRFEPGTLEEIKKFLVNCAKGFGAGRAAKLVDTYGLSTLEELRNDPSILDGMGIPGTTKKALFKALSVSDVFEGLLTFFRLHKLDHRYALPVYHQYGEYALSKLKDDPYSVYMDNVIPFETADAIAFGLKIPHSSSGRVVASVLASVRYETYDKGHVFLERNELQRAVMKYLSYTKSRYHEFPPFTEAELDSAVRELCFRRLLVLSASNLYLPASLTAEDEIVQYLSDIQASPKPSFYTKKEIYAAIGEIRDITLSGEQKDAIITAIKEPVSILTGGPGTGKTQTVSALLRVIKSLNPSADIRLCAPTGKAAARMGEMSGEEGSTIHRMLGLGNPRKQLGIGELVCDWLIVDEFSMVDIYLCRELLRAAGDCVRIVIVGDEDQLPSVGPGLVLRDFIQSGTIPVTRLTRVFRQGGSGSRIVHNAHAIINQTPGSPVNLKLCKSLNGDFLFLDAKSPSEIREKVLETCETLNKKHKLPLSEIQVLSPVHGGELGVDRLNFLLQEQFNGVGSGYEHNGYVYQVGDKVIHIRNNYDLNVFNGETGTVKAIGWTTQQTVEVEYRDKTVWYSELDMEELEPAYALTVHKSQGSEYGAVVIPIHDLLVRNTSMNLIYTAITRAKKKVILIGDKQALSKAIRRKESKRNSMLVEKLRGTVPLALAA